MEYRHDNDYPQSFYTNLEQVQSRCADGTPFVRMVEIITHAEDYLDGRCWEDMSLDDREEHNDWVERMHDVQVQIAELDPEERQAIKAKLGHLDGDDWLGAAEGLLEGDR